MKKVSSSNTKAEILAAYDLLLNQLKVEKSENTALQKKLSEQAQVVKKASQKTESGATLSLQSIRKAINGQLDQLETSIEEEQAKFKELQEAIAIEKATLEELYKIKTEAESLDALVITNRQAKEQLEKQMAEKKSELLKDIEETKVNWKREQEEYEYKKKITRRNEEDAYQQNKTVQEKELSEQKLSFEKEMSEREKVIAEKEAEFLRLQAEADAFAEKLKSSVIEAENRVTEQLTREFDYKQKLEVKDLEGALKLREQSIQSLEAKVKEQQTYIETLTSRTDNASLQVKDIALKAIENSGLRSLNLGGNDRKKEED